MGGRRTKAETREAWARVLTADLPEVVSAAAIGEVVGLRSNSVRDLLLRRVGSGWLESARRGVVRVWELGAVRAWVRAALDGDELGSGNRSVRGGGSAESPCISRNDA